MTDLPEGANDIGAADGGIRLASFPTDALIDAKADWNPRTISEHDRHALEASIARWGVVDFPIWNARTGTLVQGHQRVDAAKAKGVERVPVVVVDLDEPDERAMNVALNRIHGDWEVPSLVDLMRELPEDLRELTGFSDSEVADLFAIEDLQGDVALDDPGPKKPQVRAVTKIGETWFLGEHRIRCGDARSVENYPDAVDGRLADMVFTSPPYNSGSGLNYNDGAGQFFYQSPEVDRMSATEYVEFLRVVASNAKAVSSEDCNAFFNISYNARSQQAWILAIAAMIGDGWKVRECVAWNKGAAMPTPGHRMIRHYEPIFLLTPTEKPYYVIKATSERLSNVWEVSAGSSQTGELRACFPAQLPAHALVRYCPPKGLVLDPFLGSGSTLIAASQLDRRCYGVELEPRYVDAAVLRWQDATGDRALLEGERTFEEVARERSGE